MTMSMNEGNNKYFSFNDDDLIIDKESDDVVYNDEKHIYIGKSDLCKGKKFTSVTTLIGMYENKFDEDFWKKYKALEELLGDDFKEIKEKLLSTKKWDDSYIPDDLSLDLFNETCQKYVDQWKKTNKDSCEYGTKIHAEQEQGFYSTPDKMIKKFKLGGDLNVHKNHHKFDVDTGIFPEMLLSYVSKDGVLRIAGQSDLVIKTGNYIDIIDYKSNKELKLKSYFDPKKRKYQMMKYPLNNIMDCNFYHYTLQLSIYAWMIQKMNPDFIINQLKIIHFTREGEEKEYVLDYLKDDVERVLKHYKRKCLFDEYNEENKPIEF